MTSPERTDTRDFETLAALFYRETGMLAPGKDQPAAMGGSPSENERAEAWKAWADARAVVGLMAPLAKHMAELSADSCCARPR